MGNLTNMADFHVVLNETGLDWEQPLILTVPTKPPHIIYITAYLKKITKRDNDIAPPVNPVPPASLTEHGVLKISVDDGPGFDATTQRCVSSRCLGFRALVGSDYSDYLD